MSELSRALKEITKESLSGEKIYPILCKVISIDDSKRTCQLEPINGDAERKGRLQASLELTTGLYIKPAIESVVLLSYINNITGVITQYSEVDTIELSVDSKIDIKQGGESIIDLFEAQRAIQDDINELKAEFKKWTPIATDGGAALKTGTATWYSKDLKIIE